MAGKVVLVTGGTSGIGRATAEGLSILGAHVAVTVETSGVRTRRRARSRAPAVPLPRPSGRTCPGRTRYGDWRNRCSGRCHLHPLRSAPELHGVSGTYFTNSRSTRSSKRSLDEATGLRLWQISADLVGLQRSTPLQGRSTS